METEKGSSREEELKEAKRMVAEKADLEVGPYEHAVELESRIRSFEETIRDQLKQVEILAEEISQLRWDYASLYSAGHGREYPDPEMEEQKESMRRKSLEMGMNKFAVDVNRKDKEKLQEESENAKWQPAPAEDGSDAAPAEAPAEAEEPTKE